MIVVEDKKKCSGCAACKNACPTDAIEMVADAEGFMYPQVDTAKCSNCNKCNRVCPFLKDERSKRSENEHENHCYAAYNLNEQIRWKSSSGGIFSLIADYVFENRGVIFGAAFDDHYIVKHEYADTRENLAKLMGSKYAQSEIGIVYRMVKEILNSQRMVLFSGTSCQIEGLKSFLGIEFDNLICLDLICLGIPSPLIWKNYLKTFWGIEKIVSIDFKDKTNGWNKFSLCFEDKKGKHVENGRYNLYMSGYFKGLYSRPSCSECIFKSTHRISDFTISDCWGSTNIAPELDDNKGLSAIIVHTPKAEKIWSLVSKQTRSKEIPIESIIQYNENLVKSQKMSKNRKIFWGFYEIVPFKFHMIFFCNTIIEKYMNYIKSFLRKCKRLVIKK